MEKELAEALQKLWAASVHNMNKNIVSEAAIKQARETLDKYENKN